jgi:hypothetical protein
LAGGDLLRGHQVVGIEHCLRCSEIELDAWADAEVASDVGVDQVHRAARQGNFNATSPPIGGRNGGHPARFDVPGRAN